MREILAEVAAAHGLTPDDIYGLSRTPRVSAARHEVAYRLYMTGWLSMPQIGRFMRRHHTSILNSIRRHQGINMRAAVREAQAA